MGKLTHWATIQDDDQTIPMWREKVRETVLYWKTENGGKYRKSDGLGRGFARGRKLYLESITMIGH